LKKWPILKNIQEKREQRRNRQLGEKQKWLTLLHVDVANRSLWLMTADALKTASSVVDQLYKKGRVIPEPAFDFFCILQFLIISKVLSPKQRPEEKIPAFCWRRVDRIQFMDSKSLSRSLPLPLLTLSQPIPVDKHNILW
jgi:hypothetical protein